VKINYYWKWERYITKKEISTMNLNKNNLKMIKQLTIFQS